jgi:hypothetical protein
MAFFPTEGKSARVASNSYIEIPNCRLPEALAIARRHRRRRRGGVGGDRRSGQWRGRGPARDQRVGAAMSDNTNDAHPVTIVTEAGVYRLIMVSKKPFAKQFQRWLFHEVLPKIRRTGSYHGEPGQIDNLLAPIFKNLPPDYPDALARRWRSNDR